jgi:hypothetical protein
MGRRATTAHLGAPVLFIAARPGTGSLRGLVVATMRVIGAPSAVLAIVVGMVVPVSLDLSGDRRSRRERMRHLNAPTPRRGAPAHTR